MLLMLEIKTSKKRTADEDVSNEVSQTKRFTTTKQVAMIYRCFM